jgi:hypothetical protein
MSNDNSVYRNDNDSLRSRVVALTEENEELRSEIERLQALVESENKAIVFCPVDGQLLTGLACELANSLKPFTIGLLTLACP